MQKYWHQIWIACWMLESLGGFFRLSINFGWFLTLWCQEGRLRILFSLLLQIDGTPLSVSKIMTRCLWEIGGCDWIECVGVAFLFALLKFVTFAFKRTILLVLRGKEVISLLKIQKYGFIAYIVYDELLMKHELALVRTCLFWGSGCLIAVKTVWLL